MSLSQQRGHRDQKDRALARLREVVFANEVTRLIALATTRWQGSGCACNNDVARLRDIAIAHACNDDVARLIALATTRLQEIVLKTTIWQGSKGLRL